MTSDKYLKNYNSPYKGIKYHTLPNLIDGFTSQIYPPDSPSYRKAEIRKEEFVHAVIQAYLLGRKEDNGSEKKT